MVIFRKHISKILITYLQQITYTEGHDKQSVGQVRVMYYVRVKNPAGFE